MVSIIRTLLCYHSNFARAKLTLFLASISFAVFASEIPGMPCSDPHVQSRRSQEMQEIFKRDQSDRMWQQQGTKPSQKILDKMARNDLDRRKRVGEIFGEGCLKRAADFRAAFFVYQHGNTPEHYFQAFLWSQAAFRLGETNIKGDIALAIDRYLVSIGHKELFGTQAIQTSSGGCWCIQPVEASFPESIRKEYRGGPNAQYTGLAYLEILNKGTSCPASFCSTNLLPSPQGTVPGFW